MRVGSSEPRKVDVRIIAATNKSLEEEVRAKRFRQDLFFRLRSVNIRIPPLRSRRGDIPLLVEAFLAEWKNAREEIMITEEAMSALMRYNWPGNVRELRNAIESISILEKGNVVDEQIIAKYLQWEVPVEEERFLPIHLGKSSEQAERELIFRILVELKSDIAGLRQMLEDLRFHQPLSLPARERSPEAVDDHDNKTLQEVEESLIAHTLKRFHGNRRLAAEALDISERTLYRKIKDYGL
jgi:DNA-binding NtrC family response regulator